MFVLSSALSANTIVFRRQRFRYTVAVPGPCELAHFILSLANNAQISATIIEKAIRVYSPFNELCLKLFQEEIIRFYYVDHI